MRTIGLSILTVSVFVCVSSLFVIQRYPALLLAQRPSESQLEHRVDNTLRERGVVESARSIDVRCELPGTSTILDVVPEGSIVKKGDLLVELDSTSVRRELAKAEILVEQSKAQVSRSEAELIAVKRDGTAVIQFAEKALEAALVSKESALADGGKLAYELTVTQSELAVAAARISTVEKLMQAAASKDRASKSLDELRLAQIEAREALKVAEARKVLLEKYERNARTATLELAVAERRMLLAREKHRCDKAQAAAAAEQIATRSALAQEQRKLDRIRQQLKRCKIYAPQAGIVLYAAANASRTSRGSVVAEGAQVRERQTLIQLPDLNHLRLKVHVNETRIARARPGQPARIQVDAFPDRQFKGKVVHVSNVPEPTSWLNADVKEYAVLVSIDGPVDKLRVGLTALVEIDAAE